jgi:hypothetical protein
VTLLRVVVAEAPLERTAPPFASAWFCVKVTFFRLVVAVSPDVSTAPPPPVPVEPFPTKSTWLNVAVPVALLFSTAPPFPDVLLPVMIELETVSVPPENAMPAPLAELVLPLITSLESAVVPGPVTFRPAPLLASPRVTPLRAKVMSAGTGTVNTSPAVLVMLAELAPGPKMETERAGAVNPEALVYVPAARVIAVQFTSPRSAVSEAPSVAGQVAALAVAGMSPTVATKATAVASPTIRRC